MRKSNWILTYLLIATSLLSLGQNSDEYNIEEEEGSLDATEEYAEYEEYEDSELESVEIEESNGLTSSTEYSSYLSLDTTFKSRYRDDAYTYREAKAKKEKKPKAKDATKDKNKEKNLDSDRSSRRHSIGPAFGPLATIIFYLFLALALGLLGYLIYQAVTNLKIQKSPKLKRVSPVVEIEHDIEKIEELDPNDLRQLIRKAKEAGNYTLATRFYFLLYLEQLQNTNAIKYHKDKTNADYLSELKLEDTIAQFIKLSYLFEYVWYGQKPLDLNSFTSLETIFNQQIQVTK